MRKLVCFSLLMVSTAAFAQEDADAAKQAAVDAHNQCLRLNAAKFDDGVSPANVIAEAIAPSCDAELQAAINRFGPFRSKRSEIMARERISESAIKTATLIVLEGRKGNSQ